MGNYYSRYTIDTFADFILKNKYTTKQSILENINYDLFHEDAKYKHYIYKDPYDIDVYKFNIFDIIFCLMGQNFEHNGELVCRHNNPKDYSSLLDDIYANKKISYDGERYIHNAIKKFNIDAIMARQYTRNIYNDTYFYIFRKVRYAIEKMNLKYSTHELSLCLMQAIIFNDAAHVEFFIKNGANINYTTPNKETAMTIASKLNLYNIKNILCKYNDTKDNTNNKDNKKNKENYEII
jgi:hypothetical protein